MPRMASESGKRSFLLLLGQLPNSNSEFRMLSIPLPIDHRIHSRGARRREIRPCRFNQTVNDSSVTGQSPPMAPAGDQLRHGSGTNTLTVGNGDGTGTFNGLIVNRDRRQIRPHQDRRRHPDPHWCQHLQRRDKCECGQANRHRHRHDQYTSGVSIGAGKFSYNNSTVALTPNITFNLTGGTLSGTGTITPAVTITSGNRQTAGTSVTSANPTASLGKETFSTGITYNSGSIFEWNLNADNDGLGTRGTDYDAVNTASWVAQAPSSG